MNRHLAFKILIQGDRDLERRERAEAHYFSNGGVPCPELGSAQRRATGKSSGAFLCARY